MDRKPRPTPYVWTTWITGLLAGTDQCHWKVWVKSHYFTAKREEDPESQDRLKKWMAEHDMMTQRRAEKLNIEGYSVTVEDSNSFKIKGEVAELAGKPDIVATKDDRIVIIDEKSGKVKDQYVWQVLIYMLAKGINNPEAHISGEIEYRSHIVPVYARQLNLDNKRRIATVMKIVGGPEEPTRVPSAGECRFCDVLDCPERFQDVFDTTDHW